MYLYFLNYQKNNLYFLQEINYSECLGGKGVVFVILFKFIFWGKEKVNFNYLEFVVFRFRVL